MRSVKCQPIKLTAISKQRALAYLYATFRRLGKGPLPKRACEICKEKKRKVYAVGRFNHAVRQDRWEDLNTPKAS